MPAFVAAFLILTIHPTGAQVNIKHDPEEQTVAFSDEKKDLRITVDYNHRCVLTSVIVRGIEVAAIGKGAYSGIKVGGSWFTTLGDIPSPKVVIGPKSVTLTGIRFGGDGVDVQEAWTFLLGKQNIEWRIDRRYLSNGLLDDTCCPGWDFAKMDTWTGARLGTGGVAWCKLFDAPNATYGVHSSWASLWNRSNDACLEIDSMQPPDRNMAIRFTRQPTDAFTLAFEPSSHELTPKHGQSRFLRNGQDIWAPFQATEKDTTQITYVLNPKSYSIASDRGDLKGFSGTAVRDILDTIGRIGVVDDKIVGSNGWYSGYAVLHEPWFALMGLAINDPAYSANLARSLDYQRDHAIEPDGMVKSRWAYGAWDAKPGTYDRFGFYECQWGRLMDTQPSYVINVAELFDQSGNLKWVRGQKAACESALNYLLRRDSNGNHLVEMENDSHAAHKASDWLDVIWASYENAYVNAQVFRALVLWSKIEALLDDPERSRYYADYASKLKASFNKPTSEGGFWDVKNRWYVYWREKDGSIYGNNLTIPVNFMAIAYGICDDPLRRNAILEQIEKRMVEERLFSWPANIYTYLPTETGHSNFPDYENGDIFLAWAELGIRSYAAYDVDIAVKYVKKILAQYEKDGLAFQRYLRSNHLGAGDDILANNCSAVVGLYRDIYGIQPRYNRLYLAPRINKELSGTIVKYQLRHEPLVIALAPGDFSVGSKGWRIHCGEDFGVNYRPGGVDYFYRDEAKASLSVEADSSLEVRIESWGSVKRWTIRPLKSQGSISQSLFGLVPNGNYQISVEGSSPIKVRTNSDGTAKFEIHDKSLGSCRYELRNP